MEAFKILYYICIHMEYKEVDHLESYKSDEVVRRAEPYKER